MTKEYKFKDEIIEQIPNMYDSWSDDGVERRQDELLNVYAKAEAYDKDKVKIESYEEIVRESQRIDNHLDFSEIVGGIIDDTKLLEEDGE